LGGQFGQFWQFGVKALNSRTPTLRHHNFAPALAAFKIQPKSCQQIFHIASHRSQRSLVVSEKNKVVHIAEIERRPRISAALIIDGSNAQEEVLVSGRPFERPPALDRPLPQVFQDFMVNSKENIGGHRISRHSGICRRRFLPALEPGAGHSLFSKRLPAKDHAPASSFFLTLFHRPPRHSAVFIEQ
jgi:hypothetical protein